MAKLTSKQVFEAAEGLHAEGSVKGLYLRVRKGKRTWILRRAVAGKRYEVGLGSAATITPTAARTDALRYVSLNSIDFVDKVSTPIVPKKEVMTFEVTTTAYLEWAKSAGKIKEGSKLDKDWRGFLRKIFPVIGSKRLTEIRPKDLADMAMSWNLSDPRTLTFMNRIKTIIDWAKAQDYVEMDNPADIKGPLQFLLVKKNTPRKNWGALPVDKLPDFFAAFYREGRHSFSRYIIFLSILTATRISTARNARWEQIDWENKVWHVPVEYLKVKSNGPLDVPLAPEVIEFLKKAGVKESGLIFSRYGTVIRRHTAHHVFAHFVDKHPERWRDERQEKMYNERVRPTEHGVARATFRTWAQDDRLGNDKRFSARTAELCLHHKQNDGFNGAYERNDSFQRRREMMEAWAKYCFSLVPGHGLPEGIDSEGNVDAIDTSKPE